MATPSQSDIETQFQNATALLEAVRIRGVTVTDNVGARIDELTKSLEGVYSGALLDAAQALRTSYASALSADRVRQLLTPILREEARRIGSQLTNPTELLSPGPGSIYDQFVTAGRYVESRAIVYGSATPGGTNTGNGSLLRVTVDRNGLPLEGCYSPKDTPVTAVCIEDANAGRTRGRELFTIRTRGRGVDVLDELGAGGSISVEAIDGASGNTLTNPSFTNVSPTTNDAAVTTLPGWEASTFTLGDLQTVDDDTYRPLGAETTPRALRFTANGAITTTARLRNIDQTRPYVVQIAFKREASCDGTLTLAVGAASVNVALSAQSGWTILRLALDEDSWPSNWSAAEVKLSITLASRTTGTLLVDDVVVAPMALMDGVPYVAVGGSTPFLVNDSFSHTDSETGAINQRWISRGWPGLYLPAVEDATQVTAAGGRTLTFAATADTITASSGNFVSDGYKAGMILTVAGTSSNDGTYTIEAVAATVITVVESLTNEGPLSATATLDATASILDPTVS